MDQSFETDLPIKWEKHFFALFRVKKEKHEITKDFLDFEAIFPFFFTLVFGFSFAFCVLLCEIFFMIV